MVWFPSLLLNYLNYATRCLFREAMRLRNTCRVYDIRWAWQLPLMLADLRQALQEQLQLPCLLLGRLKLRPEPAVFLLQLGHLVALLGPRASSRLPIVGFPASTAICSSPGPLSVPMEHQLVQSPFPAQPFQCPYYVRAPRADSKLLSFLQKTCACALAHSAK